MRITKTTNSGQKRSVGRQANRKNVCERCCQVRTRRAAWQLTPPIAFLAVTTKCPSPLKKPFPPLAAAGALCQPAAASGSWPHCLPQARQAASGTRKLRKLLVAGGSPHRRRTEAYLILAAVEPPPVNASRPDAICGGSRCATVASLPMCGPR